MYIMCVCMCVCVCLLGFPGGSAVKESHTLATWYEERFIGRDLNAGKDWRQQDKGTTEDEMLGCHHQLDGHGF